MRGTTDKWKIHLKDPVLRSQLPPKKSPYRHPIGERWTLGYFKSRVSGGTWIVLFRKPNEKGQKQHIFAIADDEQEADGLDILNYKQAVSVAKKWCRKIEKFGLGTPDKTKARRTDEMIICPVGQIYTVGHALADYLSWVKIHGMQSSFISALSLINRFIVPSMATIPVDDLIPDHFYSLMRTVECTPRNTVLRRRGRLINPDDLDPELKRQRRHSANNTLAIVRSALNRAWENGKAKDDRAWRCVRAYKGTQKPRTDILTRDECSRLLIECTPDLRQIILGALYTGCRITELLNMRVQDICRERMAVYVRPLKTYRSRYIALPVEGYEFLQTIAHGKGRNSPLFVRTSGKLWNRGSQAREFHAAMHRAGLPETFVFHSLRHTYTSLRLQEGVAPIAVARQLGHKNMRTVMEIYAHCADDFIDQEIRARFQPIIESHPVLSILLASECSFKPTTNVVRAGDQATSPWRIA